MEPDDPKFCAFQIWSKEFTYGTCGSAPGSFYKNPCSPVTCPLFDTSDRMRDRFKELHGYKAFMTEIRSWQHSNQKEPT